jgi:hypothetical protein
MTTTISRKKVRMTTTVNGNVYLTDTNKGRRCTAHILNRGVHGWNVRIDKGGVTGWKYVAGVKTETAEAAYEYCLEFGVKVED